MMKSMTATLLAVLLTLSFGVSEIVERIPVYAAEVTQEAPEGYTPIYDIADLDGIRNNLFGNYILMNDIDMSEDTSEGGDYDCGRGWDSIERFQGRLEGNGHRIIGMHIFGEFTEENTNIGLFESLSGKVQNLGMMDCDISVTINSAYRSFYIGAIAGDFFNGYDQGTVRNCYASGRIFVKGASEEDINIGGLVGASSANIENSYNTCEINGAEMAAETNAYVGGICGQIYSGSIIKSYNIGMIQGQDPLHTGSLCGRSEYPYCLENCQYLKGTANQGVGNLKDNTDCRNLTENAMKRPQVFTGYDFGTIWEIDLYCGYSYPQLKNNRMVRAASVLIKTPPSKKVYYQGDSLEVSDGELEIIYEDGSKATIPLSMENLEGYDMMQIGMQTVTVNYGGSKVSFDIEVKEIPVSEITLQEQLYLHRGQDARLIPDIRPINASDQSIDWESEDPTVASVDGSGLVIAHGKGMTTITATASNGITASCKVTVIIPVVSIQLSKSSMILAIGQNAHITATVYPLESNEIVKWRSDNPSVAQVSGGVISALSPGWAEITAYTDSGEESYCDIEVTWPSINYPNNDGNDYDINNDNDQSYSDYRSVQIRKTKSVKAKIKSAKNTKRKSMKLKLSGLSGCDGYQVQYSMKKNFRGAKSIRKRSSSVTLKKLKLKKTYYVRVRVYRNIAGTIYYGKWSGSKTVRIKK